MDTTGKPTAGEMGLDMDTQPWRRSGNGEDTIEVAFVEALDQRWVLMRSGGGLVSVFSRHEWDCFLDGVRQGEFDDAL